MKHEQIYERLLEILSAPNIKVGDKLPSERKFCDLLGVNIATIRRAFRKLVQGGIVEKRMGSGTYLSRHLSEVNNIFLNLIIVHDMDTSIKQNLCNIFSQEIENRNIAGRIIHVERKNINEQLASCSAYKQGNIIFGEVPDLNIIKEDPANYVLLSAMVPFNGIPVVRSDDSCSIKLLVNHLQELGHKKIAIIGGNAGNALEEYQIAIFSSELKDEYTPSLRIRIIKKEYTSFVDSAYETMLKILEKGIDFTAIICLQDELCQGVDAALRCFNLQIPKDISLVSIGNSSSLKYNNPAITSVDPNMLAHVSTAIDMLSYNRENQLNLELLNLVQPQLIIRESTRKITTNRKV